MNEGANTEPIAGENGATPELPPELTLETPELQTFAMNEAANDAIPAPLVDERFNTDGLELVPIEGVDTPEVEKFNTDGLELVPLESTETKTEAPPASTASSGESLSKQEVRADILNSYQERFGISKESLESIEGFADLSPGQQKMTLENLAQLTVGRINEEAIDAETEAFAANQKDAKFLGKVWNGLKRSFTKQHDIVVNKQQMAKDIQHGGMDVHKQSLEQMVKGMKELGPEIMEKEDGTLEIKLIETKGMTPELAKVAEVFNEQGNAFSKIPYEWSLDSATPQQQKEFAKAKETYELQRTVIMKHMEEAGGPEMAMKAMAHTESVIEMQRFVQTCPDATAELKNIENESAWGAALKNFSTEKGIYIAGGYVMRTAVGAMAGFVAAPVAAAVTGAVRGWSKAGETLRDQDKAARAGEKIPENEKTLATKSRIQEINVALVNLDDEHVKAELSAELAELNQSLQGTEKNMIDSARGAEEKDALGYRGSVEKIDALIKKIQGEENSSRDTSKLVTSLTQRIAYTQQKISEGKMVFGDKNERIGNQYALMRSLAEAEALLASQTPDENGDRIEERLARMLNKKDEEIKSARGQYKFKQAVRAGLTGAAFAGVGAAAADLAKWAGGGDSAIANWVSSGAEESEGPVVGAVGDSATPFESGFVGSRALAGDEAVNGLDLPEDYKFPGSEWAENPTGLNVLKEELSQPHTVNSGESLTQIFAEKIPGANMSEVLGVLKSMSPEELRAIGVSSGNMNLIQPGEQINIDKVRELLSIVKVSGGGESPTATLQEWVEEPSGLRVAPEDTGTTAVANTGLAEPRIVQETVIPATPKEQIVDMPRKDNIYMEGKTPVDPSQFERTYPSHTASEVAAAPRMAGAAEVIPTPSTRGINEITSEEWHNWPSNKPEPWPMSDAEAAQFFTRDFELAKEMKQGIGRYPNDDEFQEVSRLMKTDPETARRIVAEMKLRPLSEDDLERIEGVKNIGDPTPGEKALKLAEAERARKTGEAVRTAASIVGRYSTDSTLTNAAKIAGEIFKK